MSFMSIQTGDEKQDAAYEKMKAHVSSFDNFESFYSYFLNIVKTDDKEHLNKWLLKVLFVELKYNNQPQGEELHTFQGKGLHPFDELLELVDSDEKETLETWLSSNLAALRK